MTVELEDLLAAAHLPDVDLAAAATGRQARSRARCGDALGATGNAAQGPRVGAFV